MTPFEPDWATANQQYLLAALAVVRCALEGDAADRGRLGELEAAMPAPPALARLREAFSLSSFEEELLLLCAGVELDSELAEATARAQGGQLRPSFGLALAALPDSHWSALAPTSPLRRWRLVEVEPAETLTAAALRIDERVLHYLAGVRHVDARLLGLVEPIPSAGDLPASRQHAAERIVAIWTRGAEGNWPPVQLCGVEPGEAREIVANAAGALGLAAFGLRASDVPSPAAERDGLARLWEREAVLGPAALVVQREDEDVGEATRVAIRFLECVRAPVVLAGLEPAQIRTHAVARVVVPALALDERAALWRTALGAAADTLAGQVEAVAIQFPLDREAVVAAGDEALAGGDAATAPTLWDVAREQARPRLDDLAQRIEPCAGWDDLVLPDVQRNTLREIVVHVRNRVRVYEDWGFAAKSARGLGIGALFAGPSGTGKTMAAEVLARELRLDLYRIDLSSVVSKYIGETEKNLRRVFDAAEAGGAILLFDEADALFGKRSEVKDSHDRYANIEVGYLLQRMEAYRGLAILTTNMKGALDAGFLRRLRFVVQFTFPDAKRRAEIWRRVFPAETPTDGVDSDALARLGVAGGNIRNIALGAAFLAADEGGPVGMAHLGRAARAELAKLERPMTEAELRGWQ